MERGSDKVGPRLDEELHRRTEPLERGAPVSSRADEFREEEAPADGEPGTDIRLNVDDPEARSELARHLQPSAFPTDREGLIASANDLRAPGEIIAILERLPEDRSFADVGEVWDQLRS